MGAGRFPGLALECATRRRGRRPARRCSLEGVAGVVASEGGLGAPGRDRSRIGVAVAV